MSVTSSYTSAFILSIALIGVAGILTVADVAHFGIDQQSQPLSILESSTPQPVQAAPTPILGVQTETPMANSLLWVLSPQVYLQGATQKDLVIPNVAVTVAYESDGLRYYETFQTTFISKSGGILAPQTPIAITSLPGLSPDGKTVQVEVYIKTPTSLRKKVGTTTLTPMRLSSVRSNVKLPVGDFVQTGEDENSITLRDITALQAAVARFARTSGNSFGGDRQFDVDYSNSIDEKDVQLVLKNYKALENRGDAP